MLDQIKTDDLASKRAVYNKLFSPAKSMAKLLNYGHFIDGTNYLLTTDNHIGVGLKIDLLEHESLTSTDLPPVYRQLEQLLMLPEGVIFQFWFNEAETTLNVSTEHDYSKTLPELIHDQRLQMSNPRSCKEKELYVFLKISLKNPKILNIVNPLSLFGKIGAEHSNALRLDVTRVKNIIESYIGNNNGAATELTREELIGAIRRALNAGADDFLPISNNDEIKNQVCFSSYQAFKDSFCIDDNQYYTLSVKTYPESKNVEIPDITTGRFIDMMTELNKQNIKYRVLINGNIIKKASTLSPLYGYKNFFLGAKSSISDYFRERDKHREELQQVSSDLKTRVKYTDFSIHFICHKDSITKLKSTATQILQAELIEEKYNATGIFLSHLPFQFDPLMNILTDRNRIFRHDQLVHFLPMWRTFQGHSTGIAVHNRENLPIRLNLRSDTSGHMAVVSHSGMGKSTLVNGISFFDMAEDPNLYIFKIDSNTTARASSNYSEITFIEFDQDKLPLNPFSGHYDNRKIRFLTNFLLLAIKINNPRFSHETEHRNLLEQAIAAAYNHKSSRDIFSFDPETKELVSTGKPSRKVDLTLDDVIVKMNELASKANNDELLRVSNEIAKKLSIYYGNGLSAELFRGSATQVSKTSRQFIYDYHGVDKDDPHIELYSKLTIHDIESKIRQLKEKNQDATGYIIFEELSVFGKNDILIDYLIEIGDTIRKLGFRIIFVFPRFQILFNTPIGRAARQIVETMLISSLGDSNVNELVKLLLESKIESKNIKNELESTAFNEAFISLLKSLEKRPGEFSEFLYLNLITSKMGIFRYFPTSVEFWANAGGNSKAFAYYKKALKRNNNDYVKTLSALCKEYPRGLY